ncbi:MAG: glutamate-5-semialdehyde dehydrogenase [Candidatus Gastranaerophilales bacterium]|nr:glutamate-5-semialdehyde dehydrogenase [Candidatus Gastranaerophilales bacterium]
MQNDIKQTAKLAKEASLILASLGENIKNKALEKIYEELIANKDYIIAQNKEDLKNAQTLLDNGEISRAIYDRLELSDSKFDAMAEGILDVKNLKDPVNQTTWAMKLDEGLELYKVTCPIGVIGVIFEARPDVVVQIAALAIKSANAVLLKGGREAVLTNEALVKFIHQALDKVAAFPRNVINFFKSREDVSKMLELDDCIDLIIPRGGNSLVKFIQSNTKIPVLGHADGICHIYIDENADFELAKKVCVDSKIQYPSACNSVETILISEKISKEFLPELTAALKNEGVKVKGCEKCLEIDDTLEPANEDDWKSEYGDKIVSVKTVKDSDDAIAHINRYGSGHTDCIITRDKTSADKFMDLIDSAGVYHNVSTRFADGFRYGFGAEVGISTNKTHARGPVGLEGLTIYKYRLFGNGQIVASYSGKDAKKFLHERIV